MADIEMIPAYLTVEKLSEQLVAMIRAGNGKAIICTEHNGKTYDVIQMNIRQLPKILRIVSVEDSLSYQDGAQDA